MAAGSPDRLAPLREGWARLFPPRPASDATVARRVPGWRVIAAKELTDHVTSVRFLVLLVILALAAAVPLYFASGQLRTAAEQVSGGQAIFLALFSLGSDQFSFLRADRFVALLAPLLGIAFGFDAINVERADGTLPRLVSQPIHRDDVINGKFIAGLGVIALTLAAMITLVTGFGMLRLGIVPDISEVFRLILWLALTVLYVGLWLAFAMLLSVVLRRAGHGWRSSSSDRWSSPSPRISSRPSPPRSTRSPTSSRTLARGRPSSSSPAFHRRRSTSRRPRRC